jgi:hypothetical protein
LLDGVLPNKRNYGDRAAQKMTTQLSSFTMPVTASLFANYRVSFSDTQHGINSQQNASKNSVKSTLHHFITCCKHDCIEYNALKVVIIRRNKNKN